MTQRIATQNLEFFGRSDILENDNEIFYLVAELPSGHRFALGEWNFEGDEDRLDKMIQRIKKADSINLEHWYQMDPCYGSEAYQGTAKLTDYII
ncbi:hypothetical protein VPFG_00318 [Vibrio phage nt-1]|uniref:Uncharacterized protein n=1 Tax=Vibrio phage nt-1 TaxID=115992 RepID=R9TEU9_9CAUD|nr:hypothetical protein VPFG_00318 [Vibrio phage nt-1]AGN30316.1 hypothetical protein VPFG_00318 [Vibrio phage nt-1]